MTREPEEHSEGMQHDTRGTRSRTFVGVVAGAAIGLGVGAVTGHIAPGMATATILGMVVGTGLALRVLRCL